jgi:antitoxin MazE
MRVSKWGNSLAVRIPSSLAEQLNLKEGDELAVTEAAAGRLELQKVVDEEKRLEQRRRLIDELHAFHGLLPADFKFDREEANAR